MTEDNYDATRNDFLVDYYEDILADLNSDFIHQAKAAFKKAHPEFDRVCERCATRLELPECCSCDYSFCECRSFDCAKCETQYCNECERFEAEVCHRQCIDCGALGCQNCIVTCWSCNQMYCQDKCHKYCQRYPSWVRTSDSVE